VGSNSTVDGGYRLGGGYCVGPGSLHPSGVVYEFVAETVALGLADLPAELLDPASPSRPAAKRDAPSRQGAPQAHRSPGR
jgi:hypothetical protein